MSNTDNTFNDVCNQALRSWVKYIAMDSDGMVYGYEEEPTCGVKYWWSGDGSKYIYLGAVDVGDLDWRRTLLEVGSTFSREVALMLEEVRTMGRPLKENTPAFDLEAALAGAPVKLRGGGKAYIRHIEREYKVNLPIVGVIVAGGASILAVWRECGRYIDSDTESPCDIVGMWVDYKLINGHKVPDISFRPSEGECYYFPNPLSQTFIGRAYYDFLDKHHVHRATHGLCYPDTEEGKAAAISHAEAMLGESSE